MDCVQDESALGAMVSAIGFKAAPHVVPVADVKRVIAVLKRHCGYRSARAVTVLALRYMRAAAVLGDTNQGSSCTYDVMLLINSLFHEVPVDPATLCVCVI